MNHLRLDKHWMRSIRDEVMTAPLYTGRDDDRPWHRWAACARREGAAEDLALIGSMLMALALTENWLADLRHEFGSNDGGAMMLYNALTEPEKTRRRWGMLLEQERQLYHAA